VTRTAGAVARLSLAGSGSLALRRLPLPAALLRTAHRPASVARAATALPAISPAHAWLADREFRFLAFRDLSLLAWQGGANQSTMNRTVVVRRPRFILARRILRPLIRLKLVRIERLGRYGGIISRDLRIQPRLVVRRAQAARLRRITRPILRPLAALRGNAGLLVFMVGIAGRAAGLLHLVIDHGDNGVVGDAALTRAVVVQNVTEPRPALLH
jgi:hypothetical protein